MVPFLTNALYFSFTPLAIISSNKMTRHSLLSNFARMLPIYRTLIPKEIIISPCLHLRHSRLIAKLTFSVNIFDQLRSRCICHRLLVQPCCEFGYDLGMQKRCGLIVNKPIESTWRSFLITLNWKISPHLLQNHSPLRWCGQNYCMHQKIEAF